MAYVFAVTTDPAVQVLEAAPWDKKFGTTQLEFGMQENEPVTAPVLEQVYTLLILGFNGLNLDKGETLSGWALSNYSTCFVWMWEI